VSTAGCGKPHVRWCGRVTGRNPRHSTRSVLSESKLMVECNDRSVSMAAQPRTKQAVVTEFRCGTILEAARKIFAKKGYEAATVDDVAEAAGVAKGTLYLYFRSKREIYLTALRHDVLALNRETASRVQAAPAVEAQVRAFIDARFRQWDEHGYGVDVDYREY